MAAVDTSVHAAIGRAHEAVRISCISNIIGSSVDVYIAITSRNNTITSTLSMKGKRKIDRYFSKETDSCLLIID
ncbi:MAG: hypothetical protein KGJ87_09955 [Planctomycetota bacterium]|nr:hypothetical protein [Planctomycetota bacterium]MDE1890526.1 hypothetical protein [Planctomycetota bacterium]MDE2217465.1 hypothetical protein [Planctomycetota bacterium]